MQACLTGATGWGRHIATLALALMAVGLGQLSAPASALAGEPTTNEAFAEFLTARDVAFTEALPRRVTVTETWSQPLQVVDRHILLWEAKREYLETITRRASAAASPTSRRFRWAARVPDRWVVASKTDERADWLGKATRALAGAPFDWSLPELWQNIDGQLSLASYMKMRIVSRTRDPGGVMHLCLTMTDATRADARRGRKFKVGGTLGYRISLAKSKSWRPIRFQRLTGTGTIAGESDTRSAPRVEFGESRAVVRDEIEYGDWVKIGDVWVFQSFQRTIHLHRPSGGTLTYAPSIHRVAGTVESLTELPESAHFGPYPPRSFGVRGVLVDALRERTIVVDYAGGSSGYASDKRDRVIDGMLDSSAADFQESAPIPQRWAGMLRLAGAALLGLSIFVFLVLRLCRRRARTSKPSE